MTNACLSECWLCASFAPLRVRFSSSSSRLVFFVAVRRRHGVFCISFSCCCNGLGANRGRRRGQCSSVAVLYGNGSAEVDRAFQNVFAHFANEFDYDLYGHAMTDFEAGLARYTGSAVFGGHASGAVLPDRDKGVLPRAVANVRGVAAFPGGTVGAVFDLSGRARGPASAGLVAPFALSTQALSTGMGLVQAAIATMVHVVPPLVPPPAWNNQPLSCVPMVSGHNCFGSVMYPITMADFMLADVTDSMLDGYVASFPALYAKKVCKTSDAMYKSCFSAYMAMMCASMFPRCTTPQSRDEIMPVDGSVPVCLHMCVLASFPWKRLRGFFLEW